MPALTGVSVMGPVGAPMKVQYFNGTIFANKPGSGTTAFYTVSGPTCQNIFTALYDVVENDGGHVSRRTA